MMHLRTTPATQGLPAIPLLATGWPGRAWRAFWRWRGRRATVHLLHSLDRRTLHDIGIDPSQIESYVYDTADQRRRRYDENWR